MYKRLKPTLYLKSFERLTPALLRELGIKALLLDVDNTLSDGHGLPIAPEVQKHLELLKEENFLLCILSNNGEERVGKFAAPLGLEYIAHAKKPSSVGVMRALSMLQVERSEALMVGDQLFTDIWGGNRAGIRTALVQPRGGEEPWYIQLKRALERPFIKRILTDTSVLQGE
ncbi:MAG: YqeG family HAD IIIA-type phosphatase [Clostridia bacterium]|nr:YqeG family HAD IIIA-type phosphatase [Clostridia bacterium]